MPDTVFTALDALLEDERAALISGELDRMSAIADRKADLMSRLSVASTTTEDLAPLHRKLRRNQALLDGALEGLRAVAGRVSAARQTERALETYDRDGHRRTWTAPRRDGIERRA